MPGFNKSDHWFNTIVMYNFLRVSSLVEFPPLVMFVFVMDIFEETEGFLRSAGMYIHTHTVKC